MGGERSGDVDEVHHAAAEHVAESVGVVGEDGFDHFGFGSADGLARELCAGGRL
jgi:hypothetical protein